MSIDMGFYQVEYIWKGRKKSICKCGLRCIIVRCLTDCRHGFCLYSHLPFPLCAFHAIFHFPCPCLYHSFIPAPRIVILHLWGSLLTSTVCRVPQTPFLSVSSDSPNANPAYLSPVWTIEVSLVFSISHHILV